MAGISTHSSLPGRPLPGQSPRIPEGAHFLPEPGSFSLPSLAWKEGPVGAASLRLASHSCRAGSGLDFLTRSLLSPQGFYSWFFNTVTMK